MAIRRIKIELDDRADDVNNQTDIPQGLKNEKTAPTKHEVKTGESTTQEEDIASGDTQEATAKTSSKKEIGRTPSDLFLEIKEDPRCAATFFIAISCVIYAFKAGSIAMSDFFKYSGVTAITLNLTWFAVPAGIRFFKGLWRRKRKR